jgi:hypothetical protein
MNQFKNIFLSVIVATFFSKAQAFTLNNTVNLAFKSSEVKINVAQGFCTNLGISETELLSIAEDAVDEYWNKAPTSRLKLRKGSLSSVSTNFHTGLICNSGTNCVPNSALAVSSDILISCNNNSSNFSSNSVLAVTVPNNTTSTDIVGSLIIINDSSSNQFASKSRDEKISIIAHELGHAIGLGHSPVKDSLMYYTVVPQRQSLGQDDIDGVTYLYPKQQPISCGTIDTNQSFPPTFPGFFIGIFLTSIGYFLYLKLRPRLSHSLS